MTDPLEPKKDFRSGFIAICGPPNAGKSTLLNLLAGEKISITSDKPQTTRNRILGVVNRKNAQVVFVDTPGIFRPKGKLNTAIVGTAVSALADVDVILLVIDVVKPRKDAEHLTIEHLKHHNKPVVLALNKIDRIKKHKLLEMIDSWQRLYAFERIVPISALESIQTEDLMAELETLLPEGGPCFPKRCSPTRRSGFWPPR